ncbi:MAG: hypothetical protein AB8B99_17690 [Phormidesmis sp.]
MAVSFIAALPERVAQAHATPSMFNSYARVESYQGYAYGLEGRQGGEMIARKENEKWEILCTETSKMNGIDLIQRCHVPISIARHLRVVSHKGMAHDFVLPASSITAPLL